MESREHRAEARSVRDLLAPSSVAVIGASRKWGTVGHQLLEHIIEGGFTGPVYAINPEALELAGMLSFGRLSEVPGPVQLAVIAVPYEEVSSRGGGLRRGRRQGAWWSPPQASRTTANAASPGSATWSARPGPTACA